MPQSDVTLELLGGRSRRRGIWRNCSPYWRTVVTAGRSRMPTSPVPPTKAHSAAVRLTTSSTVRIGRRVVGHASSSVRGGARCHLTGVAGRCGGVAAYRDGIRLGFFFTSSYKLLSSGPKCYSHWRRGRDSNPRSPAKGTTVFETAPFDRSGTSPALIAGALKRRYAIREAVDTIPGSALRQPHQKAAAGVRPNPSLVSPRCAAMR